MKNRIMHVISALLLSAALFVSPLSARADEVKIMGVGDILPHPSWISFELPISKLMSDAMPTLFYADLVIGNLESPLTDKQDPTPVKSSASVEAKTNFLFKSESPETAAALKDAGFGVLTLANNHILDYKEEGLIDTLQRLDEAGLKHAGAGADDKGAATPAIVDIRGMKVVVLAASDVVPKGFEAGPEKPGILSMKSAGKFLKLIRKTRKDNPDALLVLSLHWGAEATETPIERQETLAHRFIDAGADMILGHHPHRMQGVEFYKGRPIFYSLGNFLFDANPPGDESFIAKVVYDPASDTHTPSGVSVIPIRIEKGGKPIPLETSDPQAKKILGKLKELCEPLGTGLKGDKLLPPTKSKPGKYDYWGA